MHIVTGEQMRKIDEETMNLVPGLTLMERAGESVYARVLEEFGALKGMTVSVFLGGGNNAGDGLVAARYLAEAGAKVYLNYLRPADKLSPDAYKNHARLEQIKERKNLISNFLFSGDWRQKVGEAMAASDLAIDALLGTGITKPVTGDYAEVIDILNDSEVPVLSVDIPSGINGDTGEVMETAVVADFTVTMGLPKVGCVFYPGKAYAGELTIGDIGIPDEVIEAQHLSLVGIDYEEAFEELIGRNPWAHKFQCGSLLVVAGSARFAGAAYLSALSALKAGCGIVYLAAPGSIRTVVQSSAPEVIFLAMPENEKGSLKGVDVSGLLNSVRFDALAVGPGLTTDEDTVSVVNELAEKVETPVLLDADGINAFAGRFDAIKRLSADKPIVLSPHSGELKRLTGVVVPDKPLERLEALRGIVQGTGVTLVHKGAPTVIAHADGRFDINLHGHPGQATAGSGDVLTGTIGSFLAQGCDPGEAARLGVYVHSRAAEIASARTGIRGMIAGDCMREVPAAVAELE